MEIEIIEKNIKLIVLDSVASVVRKEFDSGNIAKRQDLLSKEASILKYLAETFSIPVVVSNQVTTKFEREQMLGHVPTHTEGNMRARKFDDCFFFAAKIGV